MAEYTKSYAAFRKKMSKGKQTQSMQCGAQVMGDCREFEVDDVDYICRKLRDMYSISPPIVNPYENEGVSDGVSFVQERQVLPWTELCSWLKPRFLALSSMGVEFL